MVRQAKDYPEIVASLDLGTVSDESLTVRQRFRLWRWEHGGRHLHNAGVVVRGRIGLRRGPNGIERQGG
jgi:hypothetical protein